VGRTALLCVRVRARALLPSYTAQFVALPSIPFHSILPVCLSDVTPL